MNTLNRLCLLLVGSCVLLGFTDPVRAYCLNGRTWSGDIPVYVVTSGTDTVTKTGLASHTVINYTRAAIQQWNEASGFNRNLYYAGERSSGPSSGPAADDGIMIYASYCGSQACGSNWLACTWAGVPKVYIGLYPTSCSQNSVDWTVTPTQGGTDLQGVLAHELGHAIGMEHSNDVCSTSQLGMTRGVMRSWATNGGAFRWLRRDDIEGIRAKYGTRNRRIRFKESTNGLTWSGEQTLFSNDTRTPVATTDSRDGDDHWLHGVAWVDTADRVRQLTGHWNGWFGSSGSAVDYSSNGKTWDAPAIAQTPNRLAVAWLSDETSVGYDVRIRWAMRPTGGNYPFSYFDGPVTNHKLLGLTYSQDRDVFLLTYLDSQSRARALTIDASTGQQRDNEDLGLILHEFGSSACDSGTGGTCLTPEATSGPNGPCLGWVTGRIDPWDQYDLLDERNYCYYSHGSSDLTYDQRFFSAGYLGSFTQAGSYTWLYRLPSSTAVPTSFHPVYTDYWPIAVGSMNLSNYFVKYRAYYAR